MVDCYQEGKATGRTRRSFLAFQGWLLRQPVFTSWVLPHLPRNLRWWLRRVYFAPLDVLDRVQGKHHELVPPYSARFTGYSGDNFVDSGQALVDALEAVAGLDAHSRVLDIGSGIGRLAIPLTRVLVPPGGYDGLDIVESGVKWCSSKITPRYPNFQFTLADVSNSEYNPSGAVDAQHYTLPYPDETFDIVVAYSLFTHMLPDGMERYVSEIARVLKVGGRCFATYIIINEETKKAMESGSAMYSFREHIDNHWLPTGTGDSPELCLAYDEPYVWQVFTSRGMKLGDGIYFGSWPGLPARSNAARTVDVWQDLVVAVKE